MAAPTFTLNNRPAGYDQTQRRFRWYGMLGLSGNYTSGTGIPIDFTNTLNSAGTRLILPPTYTGANGPGQAVPIYADVPPTAGYSMFYDSVNKSLRIFNGTTEVATGAIPAALTAAGLPCFFEFLRG